MADLEPESSDSEEELVSMVEAAKQRAARPFAIAGHSPSLEQLSNYNPERLARHGEKLASSAVYEAHSISNLGSHIQVLLKGKCEDSIASFEMDIHAICVTFVKRYYFDRFSSDVRSELAELNSLAGSLAAMVLSLSRLGVDASNDVTRAMFSMSAEGEPGFQLVAALASVRDLCTPRSIDGELVVCLESSVPEHSAGESLHPAEQWRIGLAYLLGHVADAVTRAQQEFAELRNIDRRWDDLLAIDAEPSRSRKDRAVDLAVKEIEAAWRSNGFGPLGRERRRNLLLAALKPLLPAGDQRTNFESRSRPNRRKAGRS